MAITLSNHKGLEEIQIGKKIIMNEEAKNRIEVLLEKTNTATKRKPISREMLGTGSGGRKPGQLNRTTLLTSAVVTEMLADFEYQGKIEDMNPISEMAWTSLKCREVASYLIVKEDYKTANFWMATKLKADSELANYIHAKLSAMKQDIDGSINMVDIDAIREQLIEKLTTNIEIIDYDIE